MEKEEFEDSVKDFMRAHVTEYMLDHSVKFLHDDELWAEISCTDFYNDIWQVSICLDDSQQLAINGEDEGYLKLTGECFYRYLWREAANRK